PRAVAAALVPREAVQAARAVPQAVDHVPVLFGAVRHAPAVHRPVRPAAREADRGTARRDVRWPDISPLTATAHHRSTLRARLTLGRRINSVAPRCAPRLR